MRFQLTHIKLFNLLFFIFLFGMMQNSYGQDSTNVVVRNFNVEKINDYKSDSDYNYDIEKPPADYSLWDKIINWIKQKLFKSIFGETSDTERTVLYVVLALIFVYVILRLFKIDYTGFFSGRDKTKIEIPYQDITKDIHQVDFDKLIEDAIREKMFDRSIRLQYLKALKLLSDKKLIEWKNEKTNSEYYYELNSHKNIQSKFRGISLLFEYTFYGDFHLNEELFYKAKHSFDEFYTAI